MKNEGEADVNSFKHIIYPIEASGAEDSWASPTSDSFLSSMNMKAKNDFMKKSKQAELSKIFSMSLEATSELDVHVRMDPHSASAPVSREYLATKGNIRPTMGWLHLFLVPNTNMERVVLFGFRLLETSKKVPPTSCSDFNRHTSGLCAKTDLMTFHEISVRCNNSFESLHAQHASKIVKCLQWSTIPVSDELMLYNATASHNGEWSQLDRSRRHEAPNGPATRNV